MLVKHVIKQLIFENLKNDQDMLTLQVVILIKILKFVL